MSFKPTLALDFDGVIHQYDSKWAGPEVIPDGPVNGAILAIIQYSEHFHIAIYSSRSNTPQGIRAMQEWLKKEMARPDPSFTLEHAISVYKKIEWATGKPASIITIDDRALTFTGIFPSVETIKAFKPWNKRGA